MRKNRDIQSTRARKSPCLLTSFAGLSRGLRIGYGSGRNPNPGEDKDLKNYPDKHNPHTDEDVVH